MEVSHIQNSIFLHKCFCNIEIRIAALGRRRLSSFRAHITIAMKREKERKSPLSAISIWPRGQALAFLPPIAGAPTKAAVARANIAKLKMKGARARFGAKRPRLPEFSIYTFNIAEI